MRPTRRRAPERCCHCLFPPGGPLAKCYYRSTRNATTSSLALTTLALGEAPSASRRIIALDVNHSGAGLPAAELERRLIELGFVEGAAVELLHEGLFGGDPIAVRVADTTIALRRREAMAVRVAAGEGTL